MAAAKKSSEGTELVQQAEKHLKTSLLKWKPDYELAADSYNKAATCFKTAKELQKAKDCLYKASDCYKQTKAFFSAAKSLDQAIILLKELQEWKEISNIAHKACQLFQEHGSPDTAALLLDKSAKMIEAHLPEDALVLYRRAMEVVMIEDRPRQASEFATRAGRLLVKLGKYEDAINMLSREMNYHIAGENPAAVGRVLVVVVLLHLAREDVIAAGKAIQEWGGNGQQDELQVAMNLHRAFDSEDAQAAERALADPFIRHMDVEYAKLTRVVPLPKGYSDLENAARPKTNLEDLVDDIPDIDDDDLENEYGGGSRSNNDVEPQAKSTGVKHEEDLEEGGLC
ncbi:gamma-soluble NSF attachment protein-like [Daphnia pulex]|uniref:gamma-soluble NSF attachment protein-like n=1 Tax=Daphnia pulex TaxID=6669 RepID=UPI001EDE879C|nr:gamma-soluble NSF attachment protein-like [Daphnia pulex]XP_046442977.1 gamma-soluble NSF attachment protein-like [Daphnia pulex]